MSRIPTTEISALVDLLTSRSSAQLVYQQASVLVEKLLLTPDEIDGRVHPLGFHWFQITDKECTQSLRLHIWPETLAMQDAEFLVHDHRFNFTSFVLEGSITNEEYAVVPDAEGDQQLFEVEYRDSQSLLVPSGVRASCRLVHAERCEKGSFYTLADNTFHASKLSDGFAATLLLTTTHHEKAAKVIGPASFNEVRVCDRMLIDKQEMMRNLRNLDRILRRDMNGN